MIPLNNRILVLDGAMGTMIQRYGLEEKDYRGNIFSHYTKELRGNNECLNLTRPDIIRAIHQEYITAGADIIESNTFSANRISQAEYGCEDIASRMAYEGARIAREAADKAMAESGMTRRIYVAGSIGPTSKSLSLGQDMSNPAYRPYSFDQMKEAFREQVEALLKGGADLLLIETCFDALNVKAALTAIYEICREGQNVSSDIQAGQTQNQKLPAVMISVSVGDRSGRTLTGQTPEAFYTAVKHYPILSFGLNCSLGAAELRPLMEEIGKWCDCRVSCYPNAGLPNEMGGYDQSPEDMAAAVKVMAEKGLLDIVGGCCGTTPEHIRAIAEAVREIRPRISYADKSKVPCSSLKVSGLEAITIDVDLNNFTNIGERTNVAGSRKFARLISEGKYDEALQIAAGQIEDGATVIDINMDDAMLDSTKEMEKFVRHIANDPSVAKAALMIDSSHWETILAGLKNAQGKCIVNSISLKDGSQEFIRKAKVIKSLGAAVVVMAFDEEGQAVTFERKTAICERAYRLLTEEAGIAPEDIIFDANILSIGTGIEEHRRYAVDFIEAVRWIKKNLPGALTSGGVSNLSFAFRGNNKVREAMHSAFLYHAIQAGLDMAIVNPSMLQIYDEIEPELLECVEDVIFDKTPIATERLIDKATRMLAEKDLRKSQGSVSDITDKTDRPIVQERLKNAIIKGHSDMLESDITEALECYGSAVNIIEGPLMDGMEEVGKLFGEGRMFLPQVVKSAKVMRDAVTMLEPHMKHDESSRKDSRPCIVLATVKGDVHDIGKNITGIVLTCNGFDVHDLGVMVDNDTIVREARRLDAAIVAVSGLITPSLYRMEELCREMKASGLKIPLFIGGATTSAVHTAVKLAPLYDHVFYGADASASAVMAKKYMMDKVAFEQEQHAQQQKIRDLYHHDDSDIYGPEDISGSSDAGMSGVSSAVALNKAGTSAFLTVCPSDIPVRQLGIDEVLPYFDWKMFYAIWGVKYGSAVPEVAELMQLRRDAEEELELCGFRIYITARFMKGYTENDDIVITETADGQEDRWRGRRIPMLRQEGGKHMSLCDFVSPKEDGESSVFGAFAISVHKNDSHTEGCCCPACSNGYDDLVGRTVRMTVAEAASAWLDAKLSAYLQDMEQYGYAPYKTIRPAAGYSSCPDHTLKKDILELLGECHRHEGLGIGFTESYAMTPESSICGFIFMHPEACYPEIRRIGKAQYEDYAARRGMDGQTAHRFLSHLLK